MAEIVTLAEHRGRLSAPPKQQTPREAEILFFTGVRYERILDKPSDKGPLTKNGRTRRTAKR